jgi:hypothetical protein
MAQDLTPNDNVCIAARDVDGDGKVEVAVGAQWNPGETTDAAKSGAIFFLIRPADPAARWEPVRIEPHDPTTHRMHWVKTAAGWRIAVLPLHGRGNKNGQGDPVRLQMIEPPKDPKGEWKSAFVDTEMHLTHNFDVGIAGGVESIVVGGREGVRAIPLGQTSPAPSPAPFGSSTAAGEVRVFKGEIFTIGPMHGNRVIYQQRVPVEEAAPKPGATKGVDVVIDESLREGHALGVADFLGTGRPQLVAGWRNPDANKKVGIKLYAPQDDKGASWKAFVIDDNTMACEDLKVEDLDADGKPDVVAAGRATKNVVVYWNRSGR